MASRKILVTGAVVCAITCFVLKIDGRAQDGNPRRFPGNQGRSVHIFPTINEAATAAVVNATLPLVYHGGSIMPTLTAYVIFWVPATLQDGTPTTMSAHYQTVQKNLLADYAGHGLGNNNTQYYQGTTKKTFVQSKGGFGGFFVDTSAYPASDCHDPATPGGCITDAQVQAEIQKVMTLKGWTGGLTHMFLLFTSSGEGSCSDNTSSACAYTTYCAYHGFFVVGTTSVIYSTQPFGNLNTCQAPLTPSPNNDALADAAASIASHEMAEAVTDPVLDGWYTTAGSEIGDLCAYNYGSNTWAGNKANQWWNGRAYELQEEFDNHTLACVQLGP